ncbi:MAG TPA: S53 family peptidase [Terriglobia bacterium]
MRPLIGAFLLMIAGTGLAAGARAGDRPGSSSAVPRIVEPVDESRLVQLRGNTHPLARPEFDRGAVEDSVLLDHMLLQLKRSPEQEQALEEFIDRLHDPHSAQYHKWLTPSEFGEKFGPSAQDIETVTNWLQLRGFQVNVVYPSGMAVDISGTAAQVRHAFHTEIHRYSVGGVEHIANASDPQIPLAFEPVVVGFASLHDFRPQPHLKRHPNFSFPFEGSELYEVGPQDFAKIYNVSPLWKASKPIRGAGETVVVLEDTDINPADWTTFRSSFGLASFAGTLTQLHPTSPGPGSNCLDPGTNSDEGEAAVDAEWSGAVAPDAAIELASCADTKTTFADLIAGENLLNGTSPPPIMSDSYGGCEREYGKSGNEAYNNLWQQAAAEGTSVFVAAGDEGAAECDALRSYATHGIAVDGTASTPYDVAVGGTDFQDFVDGTTGTYWSNTNDTGGASALSYVPEMTWNDSCASSVLYTYEGFASGNAFCNSPTGLSFLAVDAGGGGSSVVYSKPSWQAGVVGIANDSRRDLPDVSLFAADGLYTHALLYCMSDTAQGGSPCNYSNATDASNNSAGGTSFSAPAFAGIQALVNQKTASRQGNPDYVLYRLAADEYGSNGDPNHGNLTLCDATNGNAVGASCTFYDVTLGDNDVPCKGAKDCYLDPGDLFGVLSKSSQSLKVAFPATNGWDFATGLGTVNVLNLVNGWSAADAAPAQP